MAHYQFRYGDGQVDLNLEEGNVLSVLHGHPFPAIDDIRSALIDALEHPIDAVPMKEFVRTEKKVVLVVSDLSRFWMRQDLVIPHLVDYLHEQCGISHEQLTIVVANGTHKGGDERELRTLVTDRIFDLVRVIQDLDHDIVFPETLVAELLDPLFALDDESLLPRVEIRILQRILYKLGLTCLQKTGKQVDGHFFGHITLLRTDALLRLPSSGRR